jgi:hypothetical protein
LSARPTACQRRSNRWDAAIVTGGARCLRRGRRSITLRPKWAGVFLSRSERDPHQFRFIVSPEDSSRLHDLKPFKAQGLTAFSRILRRKAAQLV